MSLHVLPQVASALAAANRTMAVWDESFASWGFAGTPALPKGSVLFVWQAPELIANMTAAGYSVVAVPWEHWYLDCGLGTPDSDNWWVCFRQRWCFLPCRASACAARRAPRCRRGCLGWSVSNARPFSCSQVQPAEGLDCHVQLRSPGDPHRRLRRCR